MFLTVFFLLILKTKIFYSFLLQIIFFQNTFIGFFSGFFDSVENFKIVHGVNILAPVLLFGIYLVKEKLDFRKLSFLNMSLVLFLILFAYFIFGAYSYGFQNAAAYLRLFSSPILMLFAGLYFSKRLDYKYFNSSLKLLLIACFIVAVLQVLFPKQVGMVLNELAYFQMKRGIVSWEELLKQYGGWKLFNSPWIDIYGLRVGSLIKSVISMGYFLTILGIYYYWPKKRLILLAIMAIVILAVNSKGVLISFFFVISLHFLIYRTNLSKDLAIVGYLVLITIVIVVGHRSGNEHIMGFLNGVPYIWSMGNGLGFSGNLSDVRLVSWNGGALPDLGYHTRFQNGSESVFGVLFSSMGAFSILYFSYFLMVMFLINKKPSNGNLRMDVLKVLLIVLFLQGIFQEEAFSPYALGLVTFLTGLNLKITKGIPKEFSRG